MSMISHQTWKRSRRTTVLYLQSRLLAVLSRSMSPDALLCDIFFYENAEVAEEMEYRVSEKAAELRKFGDTIGANRTTNQDGIKLIDCRGASGQSFRSMPTRPRVRTFLIRWGSIVLERLVPSGSLRKNMDQRQSSSSSSKTLKSFVRRTR